MARIGIDATVISKTGKGLSRHQKNLICSLMQFETPHEFFVFHQPDMLDDFVKAPPSHWHFLKVSIWKGFFWDQFQLPWLAKKYHLGLIYTVYDRLPLWDSLPFVIHLFEVPTYRVAHARRVGYHPRWYQRFAEEYYLAVFPHSLRKARTILTGSAFTKRDLMEKFHISERKIKVVYPAHERGFRPASDPETVAGIRARVSSGREYVLHFSSNDPRENTEVVLQAFEKLKTRLPSAVKLVIVGSHSTHRSRLPSELAQDHSVVWKSFVSDEELIELYQGASLYVDPSLYEGFGFQLLEAMACGVPIIASNATAVPEVIREAGILIDPMDVNHLAREMIRVLTDHSLRDELRRRGIERSSCFDWRRTAQQVFESFGEALNHVE